MGQSLAWYCTGRSKFCGAGAGTRAQRAVSPGDLDALPTRRVTLRAGVGNNDRFIRSVGRAEPGDSAPDQRAGQIQDCDGGHVSRRQAAGAGDAVGDASAAPARHLRRAAVDDDRRRHCRNAAAEGPAGVRQADHRRAGRRSAQEVHRVSRDPHAYSL